MEFSAGLGFILPAVPDQMRPFRKFQSHSQISHWLLAQTVVTGPCVRATRARPSWLEPPVLVALLWASASPVRLLPFPSLGSLTPIAGEDSKQTRDEVHTAGAWLVQRVELTISGLGI